ncbi:MAG: macrocin O-methyltransferase [Elusimicrobia bacterium]|nr:macrocin O-methyltransferase [Elusimicrobiota bacterium]
MYKFISTTILKIFNFFGLSLRKNSDLYPIIDNDPQFKKIYKSTHPYTMTSKERMYSLYKATQYIAKNSIPGDFVECGIWKGGSAMIMAYTLKEMGDTSRQIYLYDTFQGMPPPSPIDNRLNKKKDQTYYLWRANLCKNHNRLCYASLEEVKDNLEMTGYPMDKFVFVKGLVEETIPENIPDKIALLRLDTDWYSSTKHELEELYPLLVKNGILIIDDYGTWSGAKKATDEFFKSKKEFLVRIDSDSRLLVKTDL